MAAVSLLNRDLGLSVYNDDGIVEKGFTEAFYKELGRICEGDTNRPALTAVDGALVYAVKNTPARE